MVEEYQIIFAQFDEDKMHDGKSQHKRNHQQIEVPTTKEPKNITEKRTVHLTQGHFATAALRVERDGRIDSQQSNGQTDDGKEEDDILQCRSL